MGEYLAGKMEELRSHPTVGDLRGEGLMRGIEFVKDKDTKAPLDPQQMFWVTLHLEAQKQGLVVESSGGCDRGQAGDMAMLGPAFIVTREEIDEIIGLLDRVLSDMEKNMGLN
jgi:adenosylmethionine-8-amino-7-oxononanoate aminotransferase